MKLEGTTIIGVRKDEKPLLPATDRSRKTIKW